LNLNSSSEQEGATFMRRYFVIGLALWLGATVVLRFAGQYLLHPGSMLASAGLLAASFPLMAFLARRICADAALPRESWPVAGVLLIMPSLILDTFSSAFFPIVYPNMNPSAAGLFGGWILCCCAGALAGVILKSP
jgi:Family of unknown function (DUF5367)